MSTLDVSREQRDMADKGLRRISKWDRRGAVQCHASCHHGALVRGNKCSSRPWSS